MADHKYLVPMSSPELSDEDQQAVLGVLRTRYLSIGPKLEEFESSIREFSGVKHAIGVSSGTAGLHLCIRAAGVQPDDYVITTPFSFVSSANVILFENAVPVFIDVDPLTGNIDEKLVEQAATDLTSVDKKAAARWLPRKGAGKNGVLKAILPVDVFGQPAEYDALRKTAKRSSIPLIEDSCEALGSEYKGRKAGALGDFGVFAFYPNKQITTGEGGMVVTDDDEAAELIRALRNQGRATGDTWLQHTYLGYNYRLDEMSAALGHSQIQRVDNLLSKRQAAAHLYNDRLKEIDGVEIPNTSATTTRMSWFVYVIRLEAGIDREKVAALLESEGIPVRPYFLPIHLQPYMAERFGFRAGDYPVTEDLGKRSLALPFSGMMRKDQIDLVCGKLKKCLAM